jgi:hypothetical protein
MPSYKSNVRKVIDQLKKDLQAGIRIANNNSIKEIAADLASSNIGRIHNEGKAVDGSLIGDYVEGSYKNRREKKGKRIDLVNLSYTGQLSKELAPLKFSDNIYYIGFLNKRAADLSGYIEENYEKKIWGVTDQDQEQINITIDRNIKKELNKITKGA